MTSGTSGIADYLINGNKSGRELSRDELDLRVCLEGDLSLTDSIVKQLCDDGRQQNYLHITLSFGEKELTEDIIKQAYQKYKDTLMTAYDCDEYNVYAEIHYPKIKSYKDKKTGEKIERLPHVHIVIPQKNLVTQKGLDPFGKYTNNINYHDAIQEEINRELNLLSPYDNQRFYKQLLNDDSEFISRYKGDNFKGANAKFKTQLFDAINSNNIRDVRQFEHELSQHGIVSKGKLGSADEYFQIKPFGANKNIRLKEDCFKSSYIESRQLQRPKPSNEYIKTFVDEWINTRSYEMKYIHPESKTCRDKYYQLTPEQKKVFINERRSAEKQCDNIRQRGRQEYRESGLNRTRRQRIAEIPNGLPNMPQRGLVRTNGEWAAVSESVLSGHANNDLDSRGTSRNNKLRRIVIGRRRGERISTIGLPIPLITIEKPSLPIIDKPMSLSESLLQCHVESSRKNSERDHFRVIRQQLEPNRLLTYFEQSQGLVYGNYATFKVKDGSSRIKIGSRAFNVSDFCTQHMHKSWEQTKQILSATYQQQCAEKEDQRIVNSITFMSNFVTRQHQSSSTLSRINESIMIFNRLKKQECYGESKMGLSDLKQYRAKSDEDENTIENGDLSLSSIAANLKRQKAITDQLSLRMNDLVATKDLKNKCVNFANKHTGETIFRDEGNRIVMSAREPSNDDVAMALTLAAEKFGTLKIKGSATYKQQILDIAVAKNLNVVFHDKAMQTQFLQYKAENQQKVQQTVDTPPKQPVMEDQATPDDAVMNKPMTQSIEDEPLLLVAHGVAPYQNKPKEKQSYFVTLSNGDTQWGKGLEDAIEQSGAKVGDAVNLTRTGKRNVTVTNVVRDDDGKVISADPIEAKRVEWHIEVQPKAEMQNNENYHVKYLWSQDDAKMRVSINDQEPSQIDERILTSIMKSDSFLSQYNQADVKSGLLDLKQANGQHPIPNIYHANGEVIAETTKPSSMKM